MKLILPEEVSRLVKANREQHPEGSFGRRFIGISLHWQFTVNDPLGNEIPGAVDVCLLDVINVVDEDDAWSGGEVVLAVPTAFDGLHLVFQCEVDIGTWVMSYTEHRLTMSVKGQMKKIQQLRELCDFNLKDSKSCLQ